MASLPTYQGPGSSAGLAAAFGWAGQELRPQSVSQGGTQVDVQKALISGEPAIVFGTVAAKNGYDPVDSAALYAYHASAPWGVVADDVGMTLFNSQWLLEADWFKLPRIRWGDVEAHRELIEAFSPAGLLDRRASRVASRIRQPTDFLKPIDDALVERLDGWRDQAMRYARDAVRIDELLQTLYAQLFVLRTVEDRRLNPQVKPPSSAILGPDRFDRARWAELMVQAQKYIGSDLFDVNVTSAIPEHVLAGVVGELYKPHGVPEASARYNFSWIDADVLGLAYEKYLASVLQPASQAAQVDLFLPPERGVERYSIRKSAGAYYTPKYITEFISTSCVDEYFARPKGTDVPPYIIDFACGSGSFLVAAIDKVLKHLRRVDPKRPWARELVRGGFIAGIDIDPKAVTAARLHVWQRLIEEPDALPLPNLAEVIIQANGLEVSTWGKLNRKYDIVLGNPPFLATSLVGSREELEARFQTARGRYDFSSLFIEQAVSILAEEGYLGLVVPNRLFRNRSGAPVRRILCDRTALTTIVDFGSTKPFDADAYVGCIVARKLKDGEAPPSTVRVIEVRSLDADFLAAALLFEVKNQSGSNSDTLRAFMSRHPTGDGPWLLLSSKEEYSRIVVEEVSVRLDTIAAVPQGIRTGGNDFFIVTVQSDDSSDLTRVVNGLGDSFIVETALLEICAYGSQVRRYEQIGETDTRLIYPYRGNVPVSEPELQQRYPRAWEYFLKNRELLSARGSLKKMGGRFYELIWPRDEAWLRSPKLLIRDLAPSTAFAADTAGKVFLVGGTCVVPENPELLLALMAYLNSSTIDRLVRQTTPQFRGSFQKFEPQHIQTIPVLDRLLEDALLVEQLATLARTIIDSEEGSAARKAAESEIDTIVHDVAAQRGVIVGDA